MENFLAADENRINLWNLERPDESSVYNLLDYNRQRAGEEDEMITSAKFNSHGSTSLYTTNKGDIRVCDFRESSNFHHRPSVEFNLRHTRKSSCFDKWLNIVSDASFVPNSDHLILSRDYLSAKLWDMRMGNNASTGMIVDTPSTVKPIYSAQVTDYLERNLAYQLE